MNSKFSFGKVQFDVALESGKESGRHDPEAPFGLAFIGDFSGRASRGVKETLEGRKIWRVDCDNFQDVMGKIQPALPAIRFSSLDDFHPDSLLKQVASLRTVFEQRTHSLAASTSGGPPASFSQQAPSPISSPEDGPETDAATLARLLGTKGHPSSRPASQSSSAADRLIKSIVQSSSVPDPTPQQTVARYALELELASNLRSVLHQKEFRSLEAAWRALDLLVRTFGGEENLKLCLVDVSKDELASDLQSQENLSSTGFWKLLKRLSEEHFVAGCVGTFSFDSQVGDIDLLGRLAKVSALVRAPFLAAATPAFVGCDSFWIHPDPDDWKQSLTGDLRDAWNALRQLPESAYLALALPRFLLRQPYGKDSDPIESFIFEEMPDNLFHEHFLWGNPAFLCAYLLADAFRAEGWDMEPRGFGEVGDLPIHKFKEDGETKVTPCAEVWLSERAGEAISSKGLIPVLSIRGRDAVRVEGLRSLREPAAPLAGRWR